MKIVFQSSSYFNNVRTLIVHFVVLPIVQICFLLLMLKFYADDYSVALTTASLAMAGANISISMITGLFVGDVNRGVDRYVLVNSDFSLFYWITKIAVVFISAMALVLVNMVLFSLLGLVDIINLLWISPILILFGIVIGLTGSFLSRGNKNPYLYSNLFNSALMILSGAVVSFEQYPSIFYEATFIFPFARILNVLHQINGMIFIDFFVFVIWVCVMIFVFKMQKNKLYRQQRSIQF